MTRERNLEALVAPENLMKVLMEGVELIRPTLEPGADWHPVLHLAGMNADPPFAVLDIGDLLDAKDALVVAVASTIKDRKARCLGMVTTAWTVQRRVPEGWKPGDPPPEYYDQVGPRPVDDPNRQEAVVVTTMTAEKVLCHIANISRHDSEPPQLGPWQTMAESAGVPPEKAEEMVAAGQFVTPWQEALQEVAASA